MALKRLSLPFSLFLLLSSLSFASATPLPPCSILTPTTILRPGVISPKVQELQRLLNQDPATQVSLVGAGSPGKETMKYGAGTLAAVKRFQEKYRSDILIPNNLSKGTGLFGPSTKNKLYTLYCREELPPTPVPPTTEPTPAPTPTPLPPTAPPTPAPTPTPIQGSCGSSNGQVFTTAPTTNLCSSGTPSSVLINSSSYVWSCIGTGGGSTATCSATQPVVTLPPLPSPTGTLTLATPSCIIPTGGSVCTIPVSWSISNPLSPSVRQGSTQFSSLSVGSSIPRSLTYGTTTFTLVDGSTTLDTKVATASCVAGTGWDGGGCRGTTAGNGNPPISPPKSAGKLLDGSYVSSAYASGCIPTMFPDYMDTDFGWSVRRVEPRDCAIVKESTPVFVWPSAPWPYPNPRDKDTPWTFTLLSSNGSVVYTTETLDPRLLLTNKVLSPGDYKWYVSYKSKGVTITSDKRRFYVSPEAVGNTIPSATTIISLASNKSHPRALPTDATFSEIAAKAKEGEYKTSYNGFLYQADKFVKEVPPPPPVEKKESDFPTMNDYWNWTSTLSTLSRKEHSVIRTLGYASYFTGSSTYANAGILRLVNLASWPTKGATSHATDDQANREIFVSLAEGLDLYADRLTPEQTAIIVTALKDRLQQAMADLPKFKSSSYDSHLVNTTKYMVVTLLYSIGTPGFSEAPTLLEEAWNAWITTQNAWGADGEWGNSTGYGWYAQITSTELIAVVRTITGINLSKWSAIKSDGINRIAFTAPAIKQMAPFGDDHEISTFYSGYTVDTYRLYAALTRNPIDEWYWRADPLNINKATLLNPLHYMLLGFKPSPVASTPPTANSYLLEDIGQVAIHSNTSDPNRSSLYFRSSRLGAMNHANADNNAFVFVSKGNMLFIPGGYYPYYNSPHHANVGRATRFKNALTFDGGIGQAEPVAEPTSPGAPILSAQGASARGKILNFIDTGVWGVATGDATLAYSGLKDKTYNIWNPLLSTAIRTVAYNRTEKVAIIYDYATSTKPRKWELNFNMLNAPTLLDSTLRIATGTSSGCVDVYNLSGSFAITKGFPIPPEDEHALWPDQYQARYSATTASTSLASVTVIREDCRSIPISITWKGNEASVSISGAAPIIFDRKTVIVP